MARVGISLFRDEAELAQDPLAWADTAFQTQGVDPGAIDDTRADKVALATVTDPEGGAITLVDER